MPDFNNTPEVQFLDRRNVRLVRDWSITTSRGTLTVLRGATSDGASIPSIFWNIPGLAAMQGDTFPASFAHDQIYSAELMDRKAADEVFREILRSYGVGSFRAWLMHSAVRAFGGRVWSGHTPASVLEARKFATWIPGGAIA